MADGNINIVGFGRGVPEWATEDTLRDVRDYLQTQTTLASNEKRTKTNRDKENSEDETKRAAKFSGMMAKKMLGIKNAMIAGGASYEKLLKTTIQTLTDKLATEYGAAGAGLAVVTTALYKFNETLVSINNTYMQMYDSGVGLNGSFVDLINASANAELSISEFAMAASEHSQVVAALSTPYKDGALVFGSLIANVKTNLMNFGMLGMATSDIVEYLGEYMETQRMIGIHEGISDRSRAATINEYLEQVTRLSQITGKNRKQIAADMEKSQREPHFLAWLSSQSAESQKQSKLLVGSMAAISPSAEGLMQDLLQLRGPTKDTAYAFAQLGPMGDKMLDLANKARDGVLSTAETNKAISGITNYAKQVTPAEWKSFGLATKTGVEGAADFVTFLNDFKSATGAPPVPGFFDNITKLYNKFEIYLSKAFTPLMKTFGTLVGELVLDNGPLDRLAVFIAENVEGFIETFSATIDELNAWIKNPLEKSPGKMLGEVIEYLGEKLGDFLSYMFDADRIGSAWSTIFSGFKSLMGFMARVVVDAFSHLMQKDVFPYFKQKIDEMFQPITDFFSWMRWTDPEKSIPNIVGDPAMHGYDPEGNLLRKPRPSDDYGQYITNDLKGGAGSDPIMNDKLLELIELQKKSIKSTEKVSERIDNMNRTVKTTGPQIY